MQSAEYRLRCVKCGREFAASEIEYVCAHCGPGGNLDLLYDLAELRRRWNRKHLAASRDFSMWRYRPLLPLPEEAPIPPLPVGWTPLIPFPALAAKHAVGALFVKDDSRNPTGSLKDRASAVCVARVLARGEGIITCASTGNAASSLAGLCASVGLPCILFVPERAARPKIAQLLFFHARLIRIRGSYDQAYDLSLEATRRFGWTSRNSGFNPVLGEGKKTAALEICEQLHWEAPDYVIVPVGDGCILGGLWKGFCDLQELRWIEKRPRMVAVQAEGASPVVRAFEQNSDIVPCVAETIADGIAVGQPRDGLKALRALRESEGLAVQVSDSEIRESMRQLARTTGLFAESAAAAAHAGFVKLAAAGRFPADSRIVLLLTGSGLKDIDTAIGSVTIPDAVEPELNSIAATLIG